MNFATVLITKTLRTAAANQFLVFLQIMVKAEDEISEKLKNHSTEIVFFVNVARQLTIQLFSFYKKSLKRCEKL